MARLTFEGFEDVEKALRTEQKGIGDTIAQMLLAGAEVLAREEKKQIEAFDLIDKHALVESVKAGKVKETASSYYIEVYPHGKDKKGVRNATKGFVAQYGSSKQEARPWLTTAIENAKPEIQEAMLSVWNGGNK